MTSRSDATRWLPAHARAPLWPFTRCRGHACGQGSSQLFDDFVRVHDNRRPHQALNGACPGEIYTPSARVYRPPEEPNYPFHDRTVRVTRCGRICIAKRKINLSTVFAGQIVGLREVDDQIWLVSFLNHDLGFFDREK